MNLYHATASSKLPRILKYGIRAPSYWGTIDIAHYYADDIDDAVILKLPLSAFDTRYLEPDHASIAEPLTWTIGKSEEEVQEEWAACDGTWQDSLAIVSSVKYTKVIKVK